MLKITSREVLGLKMINGVVNEPEGGAHTDPLKPQLPSAINWYTIWRIYANAIPPFWLNTAAKKSAQSAVYWSK